VVSPWSTRTFNTEERLHHVNSEYYKPSFESRIRGTAVSSVIMQRAGQPTSRGWLCSNDNTQCGPKVLELIFLEIEDTCLFFF